MNPTALAARGIIKTYGDLVALDNVTLEVNEGETFGLLGPNGAGKSTLINILSGVTQSDSGQLEFFGTTYIQPTQEFKMNLGVIPQEISLYRELSGEENLRFFARLHGLRGRRLRDSVDRLLSLVGLAPRRADRVREYSGGMQRRLNLACALAREDFEARDVRLEPPGRIEVDPEPGAAHAAQL